ncbi:MAG: HTH-type transcriptional regulator IscR [Holosporales bacterium]
MLFIFKELSFFMKISSKARSSVTAMVELCKMMQHSSCVPLSYLAEQDGLSLVLLEQLFSKIRKSGLVVSHRGLNGGYSLARSAKEISIFDIIEAVDPLPPATRCSSDGQGCRSGQACSTHHLWRALDFLTQSFLKSVTLFDLVYNKSNIFDFDKDKAV